MIAVTALILALSLAPLQEDSKLLKTNEIIAGKLSVSVYGHEIETRDGRLRCWTYVSKGMEDHGQQEIVFTLRRTPDLELRGYPTELFEMYSVIYRYAEKGIPVEEGGFTIFGPAMLFLGRKGPWGLMYLPAEKFEGVDIPQKALTAVLIRDYETELVPHGLFYRVATSLAGENRYYPYPPWSDLDRKAVVTPDTFEKSILGKVPILRVAGLTVRTALRAEAETAGDPASGRHIPGEFGDEIILTISRDAIPELESQFADVPDGGAIALLTDPNRSTNCRLYWSSELDATIGLYPPEGAGSWTTGGFLILANGEALDDGGSILEDGFSMTLSAGSWERLKEAISSGRAVKIPATGEMKSLVVEIFPPDKSETEAIFQGRNFVLFNPDEDLRKRGFDPQAAASYFGDLEKAACAVLAGHEEQDAQGLMIAVGIKPGGKVKVWCEAVEGDLSKDILEQMETALEKIPPLEVRRGPVAFSMAGKLWKRNVGTYPQFPAAWARALKESGKSVTVPDGLFKLIWPDKESGPD